ncbi:MAG: DNA topoisomerase 3 [Acidithiobacillus sp.]|nr:DNA topoisomerase 3 [Acidithiobacillus sp.]
MRLFIAEKPSVARAIAQTLGNAEKRDGFLAVGKAQVTWCRGHLLSLWTPEEVIAGKAGERARVDASHLPILPQSWKLRPRDADAARQIRVIAGLLKTADEVVHAGDPDREGQLLVDEVLHYLGWKGPTKRLWLSAMDPESVKKALAALKDNASMQAISASAECRSQADWMVGMNASIALARNIQAKGGSGQWSIGRVQTPTLALLVKREEEMKNFQPRDYYLVAAHIREGIKAWWRMGKDQEGIDEENRLLHSEIAEDLVQRISGQPAKVTAFTRKEGKREAPLPYSLSTLQKTASSRFGMSAAKTLAAAQELYEAGVTTYPRTDCSYLPMEQHGDAARILQALGIEGADPAIRHGAWNTARVEAHHGIIPTGQPLPGSASREACQIFGLVRESYARLFFPPERFEEREATFGIVGETFVAKSRVITDPGWTRLGDEGKGEEEKNGKGTDEQDTSGALPILDKGEERVCERGEVVARRTQPPKPFTDGTLITAMTRIHTLVEDPKRKARLRETSGLGTEATRAGIIETLIAREYVERRQKTLRPTKKGMQLIQTMRVAAPSIVDPGLTAIWEDGLADIASGRLVPSQFMARQVEAVQVITRKILEADLGGLAPKPSGILCPLCQSALVPRTSKKGNPFLTCSNTACGAAFVQKTDGTAGARIGEDRPAPQAEAEGPACPRCKATTGRFTTARGHGYFQCPKGHGLWWDDNGKLGKEWEARAQQKTGKSSTSRKI